MEIFKASTYNSKQAYWQSMLSIAFLAMLIIGYLGSRALLSIATGLIFINAFWPANFALIKKRFTSNKFGIFSIIYFLICLISYFWSENKSTWLSEVLLQLPFLMLPIGFCSIPLEHKKFRKVLFLFAAIATVIAVLISLGIYFKDYETYIHGYAYSKPFPSTTSGDHIRYSLWLAFLVLLGAYHLYFEADFQNNKKLKTFTWLSILLFTIYIHLLAAKTGLLGLYIILIALTYYFYSKKYKSIFAKTIPLLGFIMIFGIMYKAVPTFNLKVNYVIYELNILKNNGELNYNLSDHGRLISLKVGTKMLQEAPILGTGIGDVLDVMKKGYEQSYPDVPEALRFMPFNQYLLNFLAYGWLLGLPLIFLSTSSFFDKQKRGQFFVNLGTVVFILIFMFEGSLQRQTGIFQYLFMSMWLLSFKWQDNLSIKNSNLIFKSSEKG
ncbi:MAG TPA: O-antigen ligase family protein [Edaphocola sp.]|nr:O-antigen ligase family protein [Edaphocola sp.]